MNLVPEKLTIVVAGAFNPAILVPPWVGRYGLGYPPQQTFQVEMLAPVAGIGGMPRYSFDGISYSPNFQSVTFYLAGLDTPGCQRVVDAVARMLRELPHTPVSGIGFNFAFNVAEPDEALLQLLSSHAGMIEAFPGGGEVVSRSWSNVVAWQGALVTVQCQRDNAGVLIDANFHHNTTSAVGAAEVVSVADCYQRYFNAAVGLAQSLSGQQMEQQG